MASNTPLTDRLGVIQAWYNSIAGREDPDTGETEPARPSDSDAIQGTRHIH